MLIFCSPKAKGDASYFHAHVYIRTAAEHPDPSDNYRMLENFSSSSLGWCLTCQYLWISAANEERGSDQFSMKSVPCNFWTGATAGVTLADHLFLLLWLLCVWKHFMEKQSKVQDLSRTIEHYIVISGCLGVFPLISGLWLKPLISKVGPVQRRGSSPVLLAPWIPLTQTRSKPQFP